MGALVCPCLRVHICDTDLNPTLKERAVMFLGIIYLNALQGVCVCVYACVCVFVCLRQRTYSSDLPLVDFTRPEATRGRVSVPRGNQLGPSERSTLLGAAGKATHTYTHSARGRCSRCRSRGRPYMALGFPWKKKTGIEGGADKLCISLGL